MDAFDQDDEDAIRELLMGHRVVGVEVFAKPVKVKGRYGFDVDADGRMTLDDGRQVYVIANEGCGGCSAGWYELKSLERVDNIITRVDFEQIDRSDDKDFDWESEPQAYRIFVFADNEKINLLSVEGSDANGYYGTGYELVVVNA